MSAIDRFIDDVAEDYIYCIKENNLDSLKQYETWCGFEDDEFDQDLIETAKRMARYDYYNIIDVDDDGTVDELEENSFKEMGYWYTEYCSVCSYSFDEFKDSVIELIQKGLGKMMKQEAVNVGDIIRIDYMVGEPDYTDRTGEVLTIDDSHIFGTWGELGIIPTEDCYTVLKRKC